MNKADRNKIRISKGLIFLIFILVAVAGAFKLYNPEVENEVDFFSEDAKNQISVELRDDQTEISDDIVIDGSDTADGLEKLYLLRVNHDADVIMNFKVQIESATDGMAEALKMKIYDETHEQVLYDGSVKNADNKVFEQNQVTNASKKNDTRYRINFYFEGDSKDQYRTSETVVKLTWSIPEDQVDNLKMSKTGNVKVILYAFIAMVVITLGLLVVFRKKINPDVFNLQVLPKDKKEDDEK